MAWLADTDGKTLSRRRCVQKMRRSKTCIKAGAVLEKKRQHRQMENKILIIKVLLHVVTLQTVIKHSETHVSRRLASVCAAPTDLTPPVLVQVIICHFVF